MDRTEKEQDARIKFNEERVKLAKCDLRNTHAFDYLAIFFALICILAGICFSTFLIMQGLNVQGTIFGGGTITLASYYSFINSSKSKK
ncbi:MAG: hypothetical protein LBH34_00085 [Prevotellaceae bacterium]|jgi:hypothetical protein|nr:hypothetical protein [Prevotellaceae bacterium]